jgi:hypothetical protein
MRKTEFISSFLMAMTLTLTACGREDGSRFPLNVDRSPLVGADCGPAVELGCDSDTYCAGLPQDAPDAAGTCLEMCGCNTVEDCFNPDNKCYHIECVGEATCEAGHCGWECWPSQGGGDDPEKPRGACEEATVEQDCAGLLANDDLGTWSCQHNRCVWTPEDPVDTSAQDSWQLSTVTPIQVELDRLQTNASQFPRG